MSTLGELVDRCRNTTLNLDADATHRLEDNFGELRGKLDSLWDSIKELEEKKKVLKEYL